MSTTVTYKGNTIATADNSTAVLHTLGKYMQDDVTITDVSSAITYKYGVLRADAEKVKTVAYDRKAVADEQLTLPEYNTTAQTIKASTDLDTYTIDYTTYNYFILERFVSTPTYSTTSKAKGRVENWFGSYLYEIFEIPANSFATQDKSKYYTSRSASMYASGAAPRLVYWSGASAISAYASAAYGVYQTVTAPTLSSGVITLKSPVWGARGHTTYFTSTFMNALTDIREQCIIEIWRVPKGASIDGWGMTSQMLHMIADINSTGKLT